MAKSKEDLAAELLIPIGGIAVVVFFIQKIVERIWTSIALSSCAALRMAIKVSRNNGLYGNVTLA